KTFSILGCLKAYCDSRSTAEGLLDREFIAAPLTELRCVLRGTGRCQARSSLGCTSARSNAKHERLPCGVTAVVSCLRYISSKSILRATTIGGVPSMFIGRNLRPY